MRFGSGRAPVVAVGVAAAAAMAIALPVRAQEPDPTLAPSTRSADGGRTVSDGTRTLTVSQAHDLDPAGQAVSIAGSGYDDAKGIYVALCVVPPTNHPPTPCGGGVDREGEAGASQWISSNPPSYGAGLARPYEPGGSFSTTFVVHPAITPTIDCRSVRCALVTRNDHTRSGDRAQDLLVPVTFAPEPVPTSTPTAPAAPTATTAPPTTLAPPTIPESAPTTAAPPPAVPPPATTSSADGQEVTDGTRTVTVDATELTDEVAVRGAGFDPDRGVYVALCVLPPPGAEPGPCRSGSAGASAWIGPDPLAEPYGEGGTFDVVLAAEPVIDATADCRRVACAIATRNDAGNPADRSQDLLVPVTFVDPAADGGADPEVAASPAVAVDDADGDDDAPGGAALVGLAALVGVGVAGGGVALRRRRAVAA